MTMTVLGLTVVAAPAILVAALAISALSGHRLGERSTARLTQILVIAAVTAAIGLLALMLATGSVHFSLQFGHWVSLPNEHIHFTIKFLFDRLSIPFVILSLLLCGIIGAFATRYLHRDEGYSRFFLLYAIFMLGMVVSSVAGTIETLFFGWELVGLSSALLVAFFQTRENPARNGLRVWSIYRFADGAFLLAALVLHHLTGGGDLDLMMGSRPWPESDCSISPTHAGIVGVLLVIAAAGKSALIPFSGWLPRAMEGPTPSSAIFYGALSVHLGAYLLLRVSPLLEQSLPLRSLVIFLGLSTAIFAALAAGVQTDIKSALAFASLLQVSIIVIEIGIGLHYIALIHIIGHACLRTLQLLRAPSLLRDHRRLEDDLGHRLARPRERSVDLPNSPFRVACYRFSIERGHFDNVLDACVALPLWSAFAAVDRWERRWIAWLGGSDPPHREGQSDGGQES